MSKSLSYRICFAVIFLGGALSVSGAFAQGGKVNFEKQILPFLKNSCVECHRAPYEKDGKLKKPKGGLRLDAAWAITLGSEDGAVVDAGSADESSLYTAVMLPADDDDVMPPDGKADALTESQKSLLKKWIDEGADFGGWAGNLTGKPKGVTNAGGKMPVSEIQEVYKKLAVGLKPMAEDTWQAAVDAGGRVNPLSEGSPLLEVDFRHAGKSANDASLTSLVDLGSRVAVLDLSKTEVSDASLKHLAKFERLVKLDLHGTAVRGKGLEALKGLKHLRYLNLYGSQVGDEAVPILGKMKTLKELYLWDSKVSAKGVKKLKQALADTNISWK